MPNDRQRLPNNPPAEDEELATDPAPAVPAYFAIMREAREKVATDEAHNAKRLHTHNKRPFREVGAAIDEYRAGEGKEAYNAGRRAEYAAKIEDEQHRPVRSYKPNPTPEDRAAQLRAASKRSRAKKKAESEARIAAEAAEEKAKIAARAMF